MFSRRFKPYFVFAGAILPTLFGTASARADQTVYTDSLQNAWQNYSWATVDFASTATPHAGSDAIAVTTGAWTALYLHHDAFSSTAYSALTFWINGGADGSRKLQVQATLGGASQAAVALPSPPANAWALVTIPLSHLGVDGRSNLDGFWIQDASGTASTTPFYVDDIALTSTASSSGPISIRVDAAAGRHPISPLIYGVAYGTTAALTDLNAPLNRLGGNNTSRYNWQQNADNRASDYFFESIGDTDATPGGRGDTFIAGSQAGGAQPMLTIPTIGWVANLGPGRAKLPSFSIAKYGAQQSTDPYMPDAGNGVHTDGSLITGNDPHDANVPDSADIEGGWISHLTAKWGTSDKGGLKYYILDNEPSIWHSTHRDVHPNGATMEEVKNDILAYGAKVKAADPLALVVAPEEWGWSGYFNSGADQQYGSQHGYSGPFPDRTAHGGMDYLPWVLQQVQQHDAAAGQRTLDVFSVHFYPQAGEFSETVTDSMALLRNRSTRQLWDPAYTSESWIGAPVHLIPLIKGWVSSYYPGTKTAITEYNWGAEGNINGATTQADIYGIFGREGLDIATRWTTPSASSPVYSAMKLFRNYDGHNSGFGDVSLSDTVPDPDTVSSFAALRSSDGALTLMVINKGLLDAAPVAVNLANFSAGPAAQVWQLTAANTITRQADTALTGSALSATAPAQSITLFVIPAAVVTPAPVTLQPAADTMVGAAKLANAIFGTQTTLIVRKASALPNVMNRVSYLKFDLSAVHSAPKSAVLSLTLSQIAPVKSTMAACKVYGIANSSWNEQTLSWNVATRSGTGYEGLNTNTTSSGTLAATSQVGPLPGVYTWDISAYLKDKAGTIVTLQVIDESAESIGATFQSREAAAGKPALTLTF